MRNIANSANHFDVYHCDPEHLRFHLRAALVGILLNLFWHYLTFFPFRGPTPAVAPRLYGRRRTSDLTTADKSTETHIPGYNMPSLRD